ncbi:MAG: pentapeptide repeat-containing protein [Candidatus Angelobacter sp.]
MGAGPKVANQEDIAIIQQGAKAWNEWRGKNTERASLNLSGAVLHGRDLTGADLRGVDLSNAILRGAKLGQGTKLWNATLSGADLYQAHLRGADLQDVNFSNADLFQSDLRESNLQGADLSTAKGGLLSRQLAGSDLTGAKLPEPLAKLYTELSSAKEISANAQKLFLALLAGCLYSWLTIAQTTDVELITNRATTPLPIIQAAIPIVGFYVVAPLILLCLYFYFHFYLQKLWEELGSLPAVFTDGRELHKRTDPWLLNDLVRSHFVKLKDGRPFLSYFQSWISVVLAWWLVPITLFAFWLRYIRRHDLFWTMVHALFLAVAIFCAVQLFTIANRTLRGEERTVLRWKDLLKCRSTYVRCSLLALLSGFLIGVSLAAIFGEEYPSAELVNQNRVNSPRSWLPWVLLHVGYSPFANLTNADVSVKPTNWRGKKDEDFDLVKGADLRDSDLRNARAPLAFFAKADLRYSRMEGVDLIGANLRQANMRRASLRRAFLIDADLTNANLSDVDFEGANLQEADLTGTYLTGANLTGAELESARLRYADLRHFSISHVVGLSAETIRQCQDWQLAFYDPDMLKQLSLPPDHNEKLQKQMEAELKRAKSAAITSATPK